MAHNLARWTRLGEQVVTTKTLRRRFFSLAGRITRSARRHLPHETQFSRARPTEPFHSRLDGASATGYPPHNHVPALAPPWSASGVLCPHLAPRAHRTAIGPPRAPAARSRHPSSPDNRAAPLFRCPHAVLGVLPGLHPSRPSRTPRRCGSLSG